MKKIFFILSFIYFSANGQMPGGMNSAMMSVGRFYGKIIDSASGKAIPFAVVQLTGNKYDSISKSVVKGIIAGQVCTEGGEFSLENLPVIGKMKLKISAIGFSEIEREVAFSFDFNEMKKSRDFNSMLSKVNVDLGNISLISVATKLADVTITGGGMSVELRIDKKVYNVDKDLGAAGGNATDILKNVPAVVVDVDGNVTLRNKAPQVLLDGIPTNLTLEQIPADAIQSIEVITNPSAKYDASGGAGGVLNIVLKKGRKPGYSGNLRAGIDQRGKVNFGGNVNLRQGKFNLFANVFFNQRKSISIKTTDRNDNFSNPMTHINQVDTATSTNEFLFGNFGFDYFMTNRNTITLSGSYTSGIMNSDDNLFTHTDTLVPVPPPTFSDYHRMSGQKTEFKNTGLNLSYKHLFPKEDETLTASANGNMTQSLSTNQFLTDYMNMQHQLYRHQDQKQESMSGYDYLIFQTDFSNPIHKVKKFESGFRGTIKNFTSDITNTQLNDATHEFDTIQNQTYNYNYLDQVYAAYAQFGWQMKKIGWQIGLRGESSYYSGGISDSNKTFGNSYPLSLFPSGFFTYKIGTSAQLQLNFSRRINRPNFFQLIPFTNYSDSLNLTRGNPDLKPEFTNSIELNFSTPFRINDNILFSVFMHHTTDRITPFQTPFADSINHKFYFISTYQNANDSRDFGSELTVTNSFAKWFSVVTDVNAYYAEINATNIQSNLESNKISWTGRLITTFKIKKRWTLQCTANYQSKTNMQVDLNGSSGGGYSGFGGMSGMSGMWGGGGSDVTVQGYTEAKYYGDVSLKKDFLKNKNLSITLSCSDVLKSKKSVTVSTTNFYTQTVTKIRDQQYFKLSASYRFGKMDVSLFKRKNMNGIGDMMPEMQ